MTPANEARIDARNYFRWACANLRLAIKARKAGDHDTYRSLRWKASWVLEYRRKLLETT